MNVTAEVDVLRLVAARLEQLGFGYMLTGSFAMMHYAQPRMTRDLDIVVELNDEDVHKLVGGFESTFYIDEDDVRSAVKTERTFNLMHFETALKIDFIVRKSSPYRRTEFDRRARVTLGDAPVWIVTREDLILSKLAWGKDSASELQRRDVRNLLSGNVDMGYLRHWAPVLGVSDDLEAVLR